MHESFWACNHEWQCDKQGHDDGYTCSIICNKCKTQDRSGEDVLELII